VRAFLAVAATAILFPSTASADGGLANRNTTPVGSFGGIEYIQYDGIFQGRSSTGAYRVRYRITAPADQSKGNRTVLVEPPHFFAGLGALDLYLGRDFLLARGFAHAGVGYSTTAFPDGGDLRILDPTVPGVFIKGGFDDENGPTDDEIVVDFARALSVDPVARSMLGRVDRRYLTGFSDSSAPVMRILSSGQAKSVFDLLFPITTEGTDPQPALTEGRYKGKLIIVNSEFEGASTEFVDRGVAPRQYRFYAVAGTPHILDFLVPSFASMTTPASYQPEVRAHFLQGHRWVIEDQRPPPSVHLMASNDGTLARDTNGNAISIDGRGRRVPRLPFVELGEARFISDFIGSYDQVKTIQDLGFASHSKYIKAFNDKLTDYVNALGILNEDADAMRRRAALCPQLTYTETYRDHYDNFVAINPCDS
jgi:Alpha/beta hydrolase domain